MVKGVENEGVKAYLNFMIENAVLFGGNRTIAEEELKDALEFEIKLAEVRTISHIIRLISIYSIQKYEFLNIDCSPARRTSKCDRTVSFIYDTTVARIL